MHFASIYLDKNKPSINEYLVSEGLANVSQLRNDDPRPDNYEILVAMEKTAAEQKKGVHGVSAPKHRINDLSGRANIQQARSFEESLKRLKRMDGVVDYVFSTIKFKVRLPSVRSCVPFRLTS